MKKNFHIKCELCNASLGYAYFKGASTPKSIHIWVGGRSYHICENCYDAYTVKALVIINEMKLANNTNKHDTDNGRDRKRNPRKAVTG